MLSNFLYLFCYKKIHITEHHKPVFGYFGIEKISKIAAEIIVTSKLFVNAFLKIFYNMNLLNCYLSVLLLHRISKNIYRNRNAVLLFFPRYSTSSMNLALLKFYEVAIFPVNIKCETFCTNIHLTKLDSFQNAHSAFTSCGCSLFWWLSN